MITTMTWQPRHRHPSAQACQVAPTAAHQAQPALSVRTARHNPRTALVSATASHEPVIESSLTVAARDAGIATTQAPAVLPVKRSTYPQALDVTASWCADDEALCFLWKKGKRKKNKTPLNTPSIRYDDLPICNAFTASIQTARQAG